VETLDNLHHVAFSGDLSVIEEHRAGGQRSRQIGIVGDHHFRLRKASQQGKKISAKFLYNTTRSLYEQTGFTYLRPKGKNHCVMRRTVSPA